MSTALYRIGSRLLEALIADKQASGTARGLCMLGEMFVFHAGSILLCSVDCFFRAMSIVSCSVEWNLFQILNYVNFSLSLCFHGNE
jgi:hypothetical protein